MRFDVITLFPDLVSALTLGGVTARAFDRQLAHLQCWNPRDFCEDKHRTVDDRPYGGGPGMVMMIEPLQKTIQAVKKQWQIEKLQHTRVVMLSPQGRTLDQNSLQELSEFNALMLVAGRYEGIDERLLELEIDEEISIGDYVLSGGEIPAMTIIDGITRLLPGVLGHDESAAQESFCEGLLDYPHYTRPETYQGKSVPAVLLSGNHQEIARWRHQQAIERTRLKRPDLFTKWKMKAE